MNIGNTLIDWYHRHKRDLPWRNTRDAYKIWLSEIILQQTRVDQGLPYYERFIEAFPNIAALAQAQEDQVLKLWQGLGYYSRARNLHAAAQQVMNEFNGEFPRNFNDIIRLKGVGEYTAAAIASFAFDVKYPVLDGNVYRCIARLFGIIEPIDQSKSKKIFYDILWKEIDHVDPHLFNQAIMEFGSMQCRPKNPDCSMCPFAAQCYAYNNKKIDELPIKEKKLKKRNRYFNYFIVRTEDDFIPLQKRTEQDIWQHLYEFPLLETEQMLNEPELFQEKFYKNQFSNHAVLKDKSKDFKHILSHQHIFAKFWEIRDPQFLVQNRGKYLFIKDEELRDFALPRLIERYLEK